MNSAHTPPLTELLAAAAAGDAKAADDLLPLVYAQLRAAAHIHLASESPAHTLQPTALVHEAYLKLAGPRRLPWQNRAHFYAAAAQAMRRILVDHARAKHARGPKPLPLNEISDVSALAAGNPEQILAVDNALTRLEEQDPDAAAVVRMRFYAGLSVEQTAEVLGMSPRTCARLWTYARAALYRALCESD